MDESTSTDLLPVGNVCLREIDFIVADLANNNAKIKDLYHSVMDEVDEANMREMGQSISLHNKKIQYRDLDQIAQKSAGHSLGPLIIMMQLGFEPGNIEFDGLREFFKHYLIIRQLNDDAHDWENDVRQGQMTCVVSWLCDAADTYVTEELIKMMPQLKSIFWNTLIHKINALLSSHIRNAKQAAKDSNLFSDSTFTEMLLLPFDQAVAKTKHEIFLAKGFLKEYKKG